MATNTRKTMMVKDAEKAYWKTRNAYWKAERDRRAVEATYKQVTDARNKAREASNTAFWAFFAAGKVLDKARAKKGDK
jgi:hypothetical protein